MSLQALRLSAMMQNEVIMKVAMSDGKSNLVAWLVVAKPSSV
jgi:hypothetical protein